MENRCESVTFLKILMDQNTCQQTKAWVARTQGLNVNFRGPVIICKCLVSKYFKVINHVHELLSKISPILLPGQLFLHNELNLGFLGSRFCLKVW